MFPEMGHLFLCQDWHVIKTGLKYNSERAKVVITLFNDNAAIRCFNQAIITLIKMICSFVALLID